MNALKILYILIAGTGVFFIEDAVVLGCVFGLHLLLYFFINSPNKSLRFLYKIRWFVLIIFLFQAFTGPDDIQLIKIKKWVLALSYEGMLMGLITSLKILSMITITNVVRLSMPKENFLKGMRQLGLSLSIAQIIDEIIEIVNAEKTTGKGTGGGTGGGGGKGKAQKGEADKATSVLFKGKVGRIPEKLKQRLAFSKERFEGNPNAVIASSSLAVTLIRMVKIAPGFPLAPGHKNILIIPAMIYGISKSDKKFAGSQIGFISGILHFSLGFGKYGPLGILQFAVLGFVIDLMMKLPVKRTNLFFLIIVGAVSGAIRIASEILLAWAVGMPKEFYILYVPYVISQISFGAASGIISRAILKP